jgi:uncharacterized repeat protein (TIGR03847 family)
VNEKEMAPEIFTTDYVGEPGGRTFYLQARSTGGSQTFLVEKSQMALLADKLRELLVTIDGSDTVLSAAPARDPALAIEEPLEPEWRVGAIGLGFVEDADRVIVLVQPAESESEGEVPPEAEPDAEQDEVRFILRRDQARSFVLHAIAVVAEGRPICQLCGLPMDPGGHLCPASNGHRKPG